MVKRYLVKNRASRAGRWVAGALPFAQLRAAHWGVGIPTIGSRPRQSLLSVLLLLTVAAGCGPGGPKTYPVSGDVTFDGDAVADGYIVFTGSTSTIPPATGKIADGKYSLRATADTHRVEIQASRFVGPENPIMGLRAKAQYVPDRYNIESTLSVEVKPTGENRFPFELTSTNEVAP